MGAHHACEGVDLPLGVCCYLTAVTADRWRSNADDPRNGPEVGAAPAGSEGQASGGIVTPAVTAVYFGAGTSTMSLRSSRFTSSMIFAYARAMASRPAAGTVSVSMSEW